MPAQVATGLGCEVVAVQGSNTSMKYLFLLTKILSSEKDAPKYAPKVSSLTHFFT
jgi:hypothetical protein